MIKKTYLENKMRLVLSALAIVWLFACESNEQSPTIFTGTVYSLDSQQPLQNVKVKLLFYVDHRNVITVDSTYSDGSGKYAIKIVNENIYDNFLIVADTLGYIQNRCKDSLCNTPCTTPACTDQDGEVLIPTSTKKGNLNLIDVYLGEAATIELQIAKRLQPHSLRVVLKKSTSNDLFNSESVHLSNDSYVHILGDMSSEQWFSVGDTSIYRHYISIFVSEIEITAHKKDGETVTQSTSTRNLIKGDTIKYLVE